MPHFELVPPIGDACNDLPIDTIKKGLLLEKPVLETDLGILLLKLSANKVVKNLEVCIVSLLDNEEP